MIAYVKIAGARVPVTELGFDEEGGGSFVGPVKDEIGEFSELEFDEEQYQIRIYKAELNDRSKGLVYRFKFLGFDRAAVRATDKIIKLLGAHLSPAQRIGLTKTFANLIHAETRRPA